MAKKEGEMGKYRLSCHHYAFLTIVLWASSYIGTKLALDSFSVGALGFIRSLVGAAALGALALAGKIERPKLADAPRFALSGLTGFALYLLLFNFGSTMLGPTTTCIVVATAPIITAFLAFLLFRERLAVLGWAALALAFAGILILSLWDGDLVVNRGIAWTAAAAAAFAVTNIAQRDLARRYTPLTIAAHGFFVATIVLAYAAPDAVSQMAQASPSRILLALYLGLFPSAVAYAAWAKALAIAPNTSVVANYMFLTPFVSLLFEYAVTARFPGAGTLIGGAVVLAALALFSLAGKRKEANAATIAMKPGEARRP